MYKKLSSLVFVNGSVMLPQNPVSKYFSLEKDSIYDIYYNSSSVEIHFKKDGAKAIVGKFSPGELNIPGSAIMVGIKFIDN